ncbi:hypothetical protein D3C81_1918950 [compost metagenome]
MVKNNDFQVGLQPSIQVIYSDARIIPPWAAKNSRKRKWGKGYTRLGVSSAINAPPIPAK